jgi:hypothetical protein
VSRACLLRQVRCPTCESGLAIPCRQRPARQAGGHWFEPVPPTSKGPGTGTFLLADVGAWGRGTRCLCWHRAAPEEHRFSDKEEPVQSVRLAFANRPGWSSSTRAPMGCGRREQGRGAARAPASLEPPLLIIETLGYAIAP